MMATLDDYGNVFTFHKEFSRSRDGDLIVVWLIRAFLLLGLLLKWFRFSVGSSFVGGFLCFSGDASVKVTSCGTSLSCCPRRAGWCVMHW